MDSKEPSLAKETRDLVSSPEKRARLALGVLGVALTFFAEFLFGLGGAAAVCIVLATLLVIWPRWLAEQRWDRNLWLLLVLVAALFSVMGFGFARKVVSEQTYSEGQGESGNRIVQLVNGEFQKGGYGLSIEFGVNQSSLSPGYGVGVEFAGQRYDEVECVFYHPNIYWGWDAGGTPCEALFTNVGDMDRFEIRPTNMPISSRASLYLWFKSEQRLQVTDCYFQESFSADKTPCDSPLIEFRETKFPGP